MSNVKSVERELSPKKREAILHGAMQEFLAHDWQKNVVYCPQGKKSQRWKLSHDLNGYPTVYVAFAQKDCQTCPVRAQCTRSQKTGRSMTLRTQSDWQVLQQARIRQNADNFNLRSLCICHYEEIFRQRDHGSILTTPSH